jgi:predicted metal-dependent phosphotriesterase family hydrolase
MNRRDAVQLLGAGAVGSPLKKKGGGGVGQAVTVFAPMLLKAGLKRDWLDHILIENPRRFLAFVPRTDAK